MGRNEKEWNRTGPTQSATTTREGRKAGLTGASSFIFCSFHSPLLLLLVLFPVISFSMEYNNRRGGTIRDQCGHNSNAGTDGGATATYTFYCFFLFSLLSSFFFLLFFSDYLSTYSTAICGAGRNVMGLKWSATAARYGTDVQVWREEEVEGQAGGLRRKAGGGMKRGQAGD